jgi:outer membrane protein
VIDQSSQGAKGQAARSTALVTSAVRRALLGGVAALALGAALAGGATGAAAETLSQALASAYKYNPTLDATRAQVRASDEEVSRANSGYRPVITGTGTVAFQNSNVRPDSVGEGSVNPRSVGVALTQPIFRGFRVLNGVREAEANTRAARETLRATEQTVLLQAVTAYMDVVRDQAIVRLRENNVNVLTRELKATQDRFSVGEVTRTDVAQAQARRAASVSALDLARANLKTSRANYERVIGHAPNRLAHPRSPDRHLPKTLQEAVAVSAREAPGVIGALYTEEAARHTVDRIWGELLPQVQLEASYQNTLDPSRTTDQSESTQVVGRLTVPIYQGGEVRARVRQAKHNHVGRLQQIEEQRALAQSNVIGSWSRLQASRAQLQSDQVAVNASRTALQGVREEERVGQRTLLDVLNAEQELLNAEVQLTATQHDVIVNSYALLSAMGRLSVQELGVTGSVYDPEVHYQEVRRKWFGISITHADGRRETFDAQDEGKHRPMK